MAVTSEVVSDSLSHFKQIPTLFTDDHGNTEIVGTKTALDGPGVIQLEFTIPPDKVYWTDLHNTFFEIRCKYTRAGNLPLGLNPNIAPIQYPLTSLFKSVELFFNDHKVTPIENNMHYISYLHVFTQSDDAKRTYLTLGGYYEDTFDTLATLNQSDPIPVPANDVNEGLKKRAKMFAGSREVVLFGRIYIAPHTTNRPYPPNIKMDYRFHLADMEFFSMSDQPAGTFEFRITDAKLYVKRRKYNPSIDMNFIQGLQKGNSIHPCKYMLTRSYNIPVGAFDFKFENAFIGTQMPQAVFIAFINSGAKAGSFIENPYIFRNVNLEQLKVKLGNKEIPNFDFKFNIGVRQTQLGLWKLYEALEYYGTNTGPGVINRDNYENAFLLGLDLTRDGNPNAMYHNSSFEASALSVEGKFRTATNVALTVMVFGVFLGQIEITPYYQAFTTWS